MTPDSIADASLSSSPLSCSSDSIPCLAELLNGDECALLLDQQPCRTQGLLESYEKEGLNELFSFEIKKDLPLRSLLRALYKVGCLGCGEIVLVGSYVIKALGLGFFASRMRELGVEFALESFNAAFEVDPHDIDIRIYLKDTPDREAREALMGEIKAILTEAWGEHPPFTAWFNVEDFSGGNRFIIAGLGRLELLWISSLGRRNLFEEDALHLRIPEAFWDRGMGSVYWESGDTSIYRVMANRLMKRSTVLSPEGVDKRGWGRLMVDSALGKTFIDPRLQVIFLQKALLSFGGRPVGQSLAELLSHAGRHLSPKAKELVCLKALASLKELLGSPDLPVYTHEDLSQFLVRYFRINLEEGREKACFAEILQHRYFSEAWELFKALDKPFPISKFLLGMARMGEIAFVLDLEEVSLEDKEEAVEYYLTHLPSEPISLPYEKFLEIFARLPQEKVEAVQGTWIYPRLVQTALLNRAPLPKSVIVPIFLTHPEGYKIADKALPLLEDSERVELADPVASLNFFRGRALFFPLALKLAGTSHAELFLDEFSRQKEAASNSLYVQELLRLVPHASEAKLRETIPLLGDERYLVLAQEHKRLDSAQLIGKELLTLEEALDIPKRLNALTSLFLSYRPEEVSLWLLWFRQLGQRKLIGIKEKLVRCYLQEDWLPSVGSAEQKEQLHTKVLEGASELSRFIGVREEGLLKILSLSARKPFLKALEALIIEKVKTKADFDYCRPYLQLLWNEGLFLSEKIIPLIAFMELEDLEELSLSNYDAKISLPLLSALLRKEGSVIYISNVAYPMTDKCLVAKTVAAKPELFTLFLLSGGLDEVLHRPELAPLIIQALKLNFWQLYLYEPLRPFFKTNLATKVMEEGFYAFFQARRVNEIDIEFPMWRRFFRDIERLPEEALRKYRKLLLSFDTASLNEAELGSHIGIVTRLVTQEKARPEKGGEFESICRLILEGVKRHASVGVMDGILLAVFLRSLGIGIEEENKYICRVIRGARSSIKGYHKHSDDIFQRVGASKSGYYMSNDLHMIDFPSLPEDKKQSYLEKMLFLLDFFLEEMEKEKGGALFGHMDFLAVYLFYHASFYSTASAGLKYGFLKRFERFYSTPLRYFELFERHLNNCRSILLRLDELGAYDVDRLRIKELPRYEELFKRAGCYARTYQCFSLDMRHVSNTSDTHAYYGKIYNEVVDQIIRREKRGEIEPQTAFSYFLGLLGAHYPTEFMGQARSVREKMIDYMDVLLDKNPLVVLFPCFTVQSVMQALVPPADVCPNHLLEKEITRLIQFPGYMVDKLKKLGESQEIRASELYIMDLPYLTLRVAIYVVESKIYLGITREKFLETLIHMLDCAAGVISMSASLYPGRNERLVFLYMNFFSPYYVQFRPMYEYFKSNGTKLILNLLSSIKKAPIEEKEKAELINMSLVILAKGEVLNQYGLQEEGYDLEVITAEDYRDEWENWLKD